MHASNVFAMIFSTISSAITTPLLFGVIWYEKDNQNRTLINLLISSQLWYAIFWNVVIQPWTIFRYLFGPFNSATICSLDFLLRNVILLQVNLIQDAVIIVSYICIFCCKNPTALQDDFWRLFINLWALGFSIISQLTYVISPGKNPVNYYLCLGEYPVKLQERSTKFNLIHMVFISSIQLMAIIPKS